MSESAPGNATAIEEFVRSDLFRAILRTQHADLLAGSANAVAAVPTGAVVPYATETAPDGWLLCTGQDVYKDAYPALFAVLGTKYGTPADTLKFRLPDLQGRVPVGYGTGYATLNSPGGSADSVIVSHDHGGYTGYDNPRHGHETTPAGAHGHTNIHPSGNLSGSTFGYQMVNHNNAYGSLGQNAVGDHTHGVTDTDINHRHTISPSGESGVGKNLQPYIVLNYIIRT